MIPRDLGWGNRCNVPHRPPLRTSLVHVEKFYPYTVDFFCLVTIELPTFSLGVYTMVFNRYIRGKRTSGGYTRKKKYKSY